MAHFTSSASIRPKKPILYRFVRLLKKILGLTCVCFSPCVVSLVSRVRKPKYAFVGQILWFVFGILVSLSMYQIFLVDLGMDVQKTYTVAFLVTAIISIGSVTSRQIRAISLLTLSTFLGKSGQSALKALVLSFVVSGPIQNLADNSQEVVRVFACTTSLTYNMTKTRYELIFKPFSDALFGMKADTNDLKESLHSVRDVIEPIRKELQDESEGTYLKEPNEYLDEFEKLGQEQNQDTKGDHIKPGETDNAPDEVEKKYKKKLKFRCEGMVTRAKMKCTQTFSNVFNSCMDKLHWAVNWALCWPMKLTFICNFASSFGDACEPEKHISPGFGKGFVTLNETRNEMQNQFKEVKMQYKVSKFLKIPAGLKDNFDRSNELIAQFTEKKQFADFILWLVVKWILAFSFMRVMWKAEKYQRFYLTNIEFDNVYITDYFRKIDSRRRSQNKQTVLPLKKIEKNKFVDPYSFTIPWSSIGTPIVKLLLELVPVTTFVFVDRVFYEVLYLIHKHSYIEYTQVGYHDLSLNVKGTGLIASLVRSVVKGFNIKRRVKVERSNMACLPQPTLLSVSFIYKIYGTFFCVFLMILFNGYLKRVRRLCCALFFRKHEKRRVLYLYNETLRRRRSFFKFKKSRVSRLVKENRVVEEMNLMLLLRLKFPRYFKWLYIFSAARRKCLICREPEKRYWPKIACPGCPYVFCQECWDMIDHNCYICEPISEDEQNLTDDEFKSNESE